MMIGNCIDELGLREASVSVREEDIIVEAPGRDQSEFDRTKDIISRTARLEFKICDDENTWLRGQGPLPEGITLDNESGIQVGEGRTTSTPYLLAKGPEARRRLELYARTLAVPEGLQLALGDERERDTEGRPQADVYWRTYLLHRRADVTGDMVSDARVERDPQDGSPYVSLNFNPNGASRFEEITGTNVKRRMAIVLDGRVYSAPIIQSRIGGGRAQITLGGYMDFRQRQQEALDLTIVLQAGSLPAPINLSQEQRIGPSLGADSIRQGIAGATMGVGLVLLFILFYYQAAGIIAAMAVLMNLLFLVASLASLGAALTLPGIAAMALTVGMAVDANVLINERIREELRLGKTPRAAVEAGYARALSAIIDGQVTTAIAGFILWQFGTGPIKGFGITLVLGIVTSVFTGVFVTRIVFDWLVRGRRVERLNMG